MTDRIRNLGFLGLVVLIVYEEFPQYLSLVGVGALVVAALYIVWDLELYEATTMREDEL